MYLRIVLFIISFFAFSAVFGQSVEYNKLRIEGIKKIGTLNMSELPQDYNAHIQHLEAPEVSGKTYQQFLKGLKEEISIQYPRQLTDPVDLRGSGAPPRVIHSFFGNLSGVGTPLDTHLAVSDDGQIISTINSHIAIMDKDGQTISSAGFTAFSISLDLASNLFDPRVFYDQAEDRFVLLFLAGNDSGETNIMVAFSQTNDASGDWSFYSLEGNPFMLNTWTDFPMITITPTDVMITINLVQDDVSWQLGFVETLIWQLDKETGYEGEELSLNMWSDIKFDDKSIRNLCPVKSGDGNPSSNTFFMSNKNFSVESDTIFLVEITGGVNDPATSIEIELLKSDIPYGAPPNAKQPFGGDLQTNDARVLDAFVYNDEIHFVGNTRNLDNNTSGIYHGRILNLSGSRDILLNHITGLDFEIGYPGISLAGTPSSEEGAMISFTHASEDRNPGISAMYYSFLDGYSDIIEVAEGTTFIDMIGNVERWGDYAGSQRKYNDPEVIWISGTLGFGNFNRNHPWVAALATPEGVLSNEEPENEIEHKLFPNPFQNIFYIEFEVPNDASKLSIEVIDFNGAKVDVLLNDKAVQVGKNRLGFDGSKLLPGTYLLNMLFDNGQSKIEKVIVQ